MKKLLAIVFITMFFATPVIAGEMKLTAHYEMYSNEHLDSGYGAQLWYGSDDLRHYLFLSYSVADFKWGAQPWAVINLFGLGIGMTRPITKDISFYGQIGYYYPMVEHAPSEREALNNYTIDQYSYVSKLYPSHVRDKFAWPDHSFEVQGNFGGKLGMTAKWNIYKNLDFNADIGYRILSLRHATEISDPKVMAKNPNGQWCWGQDIDYSGMSLSAGLTWRF